jgi:hypothetical protein
MKDLEVEDDLAKGGTIMTDSLQRKMETVRSKINDTDIQMQNITARLLELIQESDPQRGEEKDILSREYSRLERNHSCLHLEWIDVRSKREGLSLLFAASPSLLLSDCLCLCSSCSSVPSWFDFACNCLLIH